jgi:hypothetical protein
MTALRDIKGPVPLPDGHAVLLWLLLAAALCLAGLVCWRWRRGRRPGCRVLARVRAGCAALARDGAALDARVYYFRLAELARQALAVRLGLAAAAMTAAELAPHLAVLPADARSALAGLFTRADAACFAGEDVASDARAADLAAVRRLAGRRGAC